MGIIAHVVTWSDVIMSCPPSFTRPDHPKLRKANQPMSSFAFVAPATLHDASAPKLQHSISKSGGLWTLDFHRIVDNLGYGLRSCNRAGNTRPAQDEVEDVVRLRQWVRCAAQHKRLSGLSRFAGGAAGGQ